MDLTATGDAFFTTSGSSPPGNGAQALTGNEAAPIQPRPLPPELIEELAALLASALVEDIRQFPNLADIKANQDSTVQSPRGHDRTQGARGRTRQPASRSSRRPRTSPPR